MTSRPMSFRFAVPLLMGVAALMAACETEFIPDIPPIEQQIVVEGFIEAGDQPLPPVVILTRNVPFFREISSEALSNLFVHDAEVYVREGDREIQLTEICLDNLTPVQRELISQFLGFPTDSAGLNFCAYTDLSFQMLGEAGKTYQLEIVADSQMLSATTSIPQLVPLNILGFEQPPGEPSDTLRELRVRIQDPAGESNFYRYFTRTDGGNLIAPFNSVTDDRLFDGEAFEFPLAKAEGPDSDFDLETFGLYTLGDSVTVKWTSIDQAHFDFWNTLEFNQANQGPFSSYTVIDNNIEGGLGIWGGYAALYYDLVVSD